LLVCERRKLIAAAFHRAGHDVERALQRPDLGHARLGHAHREVAGGHPTGHVGRPAHGQHDRPGEVAPDEQDQQDRSGEPHRDSDDGTPGRGLGAVLAFGGEVAFRGPELVELGAQRVDPPPAVQRRRHAGRRGVAGPGRRYDRERVVPQVGVDRLGDLLGPGVLAGDQGQPLQLPGGVRQRCLRRRPGLEEALVPGEDEAPLARLEVDDQPLEVVGRDQHPLGVPRQSRRFLLVVDGGQQHGERAAHDQREQTAREDHPGDQPSSHHQGQ
jgi:hypothetical protein